MFSRLVKQMAESEGVAEQLKAENPMVVGKSPVADAVCSHLKSLLTMHHSAE
jgi:hypothetical protein